MTTRSTGRKMQLYTSVPGGKTKQDHMKRLGLGIMICSSRGSLPRQCFSEFPLALDNGAYSAWRKGYPFDEYIFLKTLSKCLELSLKLNFIVAPDLIGGGEKSLDFSLRWAERIPCGNLALVIQKGMRPESVEAVLDRFSYLFIGTPDDPQWKWSNAATWISLAQRHGKKCHIGACGTPDKMVLAKNLGADSIDSSSWVRNDTWHHVERYQKLSSGFLLKYGVWDGL